MKKFKLLKMRGAEKYFVYELKTFFKWSWWKRHPYGYLSPSSARYFMGYLSGGEPYGVIYEESNEL